MVRGHRPDERVVGVAVGESYDERDESGGYLVVRDVHDVLSADDAGDDACSVFTADVQHGSLGGNDNVHRHECADAGAVVLPGGNAVKGKRKNEEDERSAEWEAQSADRERGKSL